MLRLLIPFLLVMICPQKMLAWSELLVKGSTSGDSNWSTIATLTQGSDANSWSGTINASSWTSGTTLSFKLYDSKDDNTTYWWGNGSATADMTSASTATISTSTVNSTGDNMTLKHNTAYSSYTISCTYSNSSWAITITGVSSGSDGSDAGTTTKNEPGYYIYGDKYGTTDPTQKMVYKLLQRSENQYYISVLAGQIASNDVNGQLYSTGQGANYEVNNNGSTFRLAYVDANGKVTTYGRTWTLTSSDTNHDKALDFGSSTSDYWKIENNGGSYDFIVNVNDEGVPQTWQYTSDPLKIVAYRVGASSNWTTDAFLYCTRSNSTSSYNKNFFGTVTFKQDEEFLFRLADNWYGHRPNNQSDTYAMDLAMQDASGANTLTTAHRLKFQYDDGVYTTEFNFERDYQIQDKRPVRIFITGPSVGTETSGTFTDWTPGNAIELKYSTADGSYKGLLKFTKGEDIRFLLDRNASGAATSLETNFGEDGGAESLGSHSGDTDYNNYVDYNSASTSGHNVTVGTTDDFTTNYYTIRFYIERKADKTGFNWASDGIYHYTLDPVSRPYAVISPAASTVYGQVSVTPSVQFVNPSTTTTIAEANQIVVYTLDGTNPAINTSTGDVATGSTAKKVTSAATAQSIGTLTYNGTNIVDNDGNVIVSGSNKVTVTAQAVRIITTDNGTIYELSGSPVSETYTLNKLSIKIDPGTMTVNYGEYVTPAVTVTDNNATSGSTLNYVYTLDGTEPTISKDGQTVNGKLVSYTPDDVITSNNPVGTLYMDGNGNIQEQGTTTSPITTGNTAVTIKAYAVNVQTLDGTTTYEAQGNLASATYTFKKAGGVSPTASYTISVSNDAGSDAVSVNKATATVTVVNSSTNTNDGVAVYYTTDGTDPSTSDTRHLVRNRKITVYALGQNVGSTQKIRVAIAGSSASTTDDGKTHASCTYDLTYSTSEGGYKNYLNNDQNAKTLGGEGHVIIYVKPSDTSVKTYVYAYENITGTDGTTTANLLTPMEPGRELTSNDQTTVNGETWYYLDAEPTSGYKEINLQISSASKTGYVTVANINKDVFLEFNTTTGVITDVTRAHTADYFYTTGATSGNTKDEAANPTADAPFIYVQVPAEWATSPNTLKILDSNDKEISGATYTKQNGAETSANSVCYKISGLTGLTNGTSTIKFAPYNTTSSSYGTLANHSFSTTYQNGGYYYYESSSVNGLGLVFTPTTGEEKDVRSKGHHDINHVTTGDKTHYFSKDWTYSTEPTSKTSTATDNWNGSSATVNDIAAGTTISQTVSGLTASTSYTVQMIVRGENGATGTLTLDGASTGTDTKSFSGKNAAGTVTTDGRVDALLSGTTNGWQKLEATANSDVSGNLKISLTAASGALQLSDVTLLEKANTDGYVQTRATTNESTTESNLSDRTKANAYSFFDRGENKNAIVYVNAKTVEGMSSNTINIAKATTTDGTTTYSMAKLALTDTDGKKNTLGSATNSNSFKITKENVTAKDITYDRDFNTAKSTLCLPFALTNQNLVDMGISKVYTFGGMSETTTANVFQVDVTEQDVSSSSSVSTEGGKPYIVQFSEEKSTGFTLTGVNTTVVTGDAGQQVSTDGDVFQGVYKLDSIPFNQWDNDGISVRYWTYNGTSSAGDLGRFSPARYKDEGTNTICRPFRGYFIVKEANKAKVRSLILSIHNGDRTTDIDAVEFMHGDLTAPVYNLSGQMVQRVGNIGSLPKGVYIQNHKKFVVR